MRNALLTCMLLFLVGTSYGQTQRIYQDLLPEGGKYLDRGWVFSPSINYMLPSIKHTHQRLWTPSKEAWDMEYRGAGKVGLGFGFGRFHIIRTSRLVNYVSLTMGVKHFRAVERFDAVLHDPNRENPFLRTGEGTFAHTYATLAFDVSSIKRLSRSTFLENSLGINGDFRVMESEHYNKNALPIGLNTPTRFIFQAHYRLGFGMKVSDRIFVVPSVETPIVTFYEYQDLKSTLEVFNVRYRPLIFSVNIMMADKRASRKCPTKYSDRKSNEVLFGGKNRPW
ncbi:MAG TPA: hypothetical protein VKY29_05440 [Cryomorphaceae bacterium]|nr:hypothetical protein [Cryomorphaceae bacterium]